MKNKENKIIEILEKNDFKIEKEEIETWTNAGVNMIFGINSENDLEEEILSLIDGFDIDEQITVNRYNKQYCNDFTYSESVEDFTEFKEMLEKIREEITKI